MGLVDGVRVLLLVLLVLLLLLLLRLGELAVVGLHSVRLAGTLLGILRRRRVFDDLLEPPV